MSLEKIIRSVDFTNDDGDIIYFNSGRDNISGKFYPNHYVRNKDNYTYTRILNISLSPDTSLVYPIHECFLLTTYKNDNTHGITNIINIDGIAREGTIKAQDLKITCTPITYGVLDTDYSVKIHEIKAALKEVTIDGDLKLALGIWLNTRDIIDIIIKDLSSLAYNEIPNNIYTQFLQCDYKADYLDNEEVMYEVNMFTFEESIGTKLVEGKNINQDILTKIKNINDTAISSVPAYQFLTVIYDDMYEINNVNVDEVIKPTAFQYVEVGNSFAKINKDSGYLQVNEEGNYIIALKINMDIHEDTPTKMMMSLFLNDDRIEETTTTLYLDPHDKKYPLGFLSGQAQILLKPTDKLYLKVRWTDKDNVFIENHCQLQITRLNIIKK